MKLLLDQNISYRLVRKIESLFPGTQQVRRLGHDNKTDRFLWEFAKANDFTIVSYDSDFYDLSQKFGHPPKLLWITSGNRTTENLKAMLETNFSSIEAFHNDNSSCLELKREI